MPPLPISSMSKSFQPPERAFWPKGAAKSMIRDTEQSAHRQTISLRIFFGFRGTLTETRELAIEHVRARTSFVKTVEALRGTHKRSDGAKHSDTITHIVDIARDTPTVCNSLHV